MDLVNPYNLLGITIDSPVKELRKNYYELALLCHPDKGGNEKDMIVLHRAYLYCKQQLEHAEENKISMDEAQKEFDNFFNSNKDIIQEYQEIWKNSSEYEFFRKFNQQFDMQKEVETQNIAFSKGYGSLMDKTDIFFDDEMYIILENKLNKSNGTRQIIKHIVGYLNRTKYPFKSEMIIYKEPLSINDFYGNQERFDVKNVSDFSSTINTLQMSDYRLAHSDGPLQIEEKKPQTLEELMKERESLLNER